MHSWCPPKPFTASKLSAENELESKCLAGMRILFGGPARLENRDKHQTNKEHNFSCVKTSWNSFCKDLGKGLGMEDALFNMNKAVCEAHLLANSHVMRMCQENKPIDALNQSFFYTCLKAVTSANRQKMEIRDAELRLSAQIYLAMRPTACLLAKSDNLSAGLHNNASQQMAINTSNYIAMTLMTLYQRVTGYVKHRFNVDGRTTYAIFQAMQDEVYDGEDEIVLGLRQKLPQGVKSSPEQYMPLLFEILRYNEVHNPLEIGDERYDKRIKQVKLFTLLPTKNGFECSHIKICGTGLFSLLKRDKLLNDWTKEQFEKTKESWWRSLFNIKRYETSGRKFAGEILTDGVGVSILMRVQANKHGTEELQPKKARKKKSISKSKKQTKEAPIDIQSYERIVGLDPGRKSLFVTCDMQNRHLECSSKEFYQDAKYLESRRKTKKWIDKNDEVKEAVTNMPTKKTCSLSVFQKYVSFLLPRLDTLLRFFQQKKFRNQKFKRYIFCKRKLSDLNIRDLLLAIARSQPRPTCFCRSDRDKLIKVPNCAD